MTNNLISEIDRESTVPLHRQVENWLREQIRSGSFAAGSKVPARKHLSDMLGGVNHLTINKAVMTLTKEGLIYSTVGRGTFVAKPMNKKIRIALVLPNIEDEHTQGIARGVQSFCALETQGDEAADGRQKIAVVLFDSRRDSVQELENVKHLEDFPLDGAIIWPLGYGDMVEHLVKLKSDRFPLVLLDEIPGIKFNTVCSSDYEGGYELTKHVVATGRKRLAWISNRKHYFSSNARFEGYRDALADSGLAVDRKLTCQLEVATPSVPFKDALEDVVERLFIENPPDAILCGNDFEAVAVIKLLHKRGISIPGEVSVSGFGGLSVGADMSPTLTTGVIPSEKIGRTAASLLLRVIENAALPAQQIKLSIPLMIRQSA